jgi:hypothetical protein
MSNLKEFACLVVAITAASTATPETHCPGNVVSVPYLRHQMVVEVSINNTGPYSFLLDTGTQMTVVDPTLAASLHLAEHGDAKVASEGMNAEASFSQLHLLEANQHKVMDLKILVYDLENLRALGLNIQGILGEDFLRSFDVLIDNVHQQLCLDDTGTMGAEIKGVHIPLLPSAPAADETLPNPLIVSARLSDGMRPVHLKLDSGANVSLLYNTSDYLALGTFNGVSVQGGGATGAKRSFKVLPIQNMKIGSVEVNKVEFLTMSGVRKDSRISDFDGLLTLGLFRRVFVNHADHYVVLDPW